MRAGLSPGQQVAVGSIELTSLPDAVGILGAFDELYPDVPADAWEPYRGLYPELFAGGEWRLPVACFLISAGGRTILVDAGVGPPGSWDWQSEREGGLPPALAAHGVEPDGLDAVFLSHLHIDHVGWLADEALYPSARVLVHGDALAFAIENSTVPGLPGRLRGLVEQGRVDTLSADAELAPGVTSWALPGHYPGHLGLRLESGTEQAVLIVDAAVHPALLDRPDWNYRADLDREPCVATRHAVVAELVDSGTVVACGHYPGSAIGRIVRRDGRIVWEECA